jgi:hypothetical protein
MACTYLGEIIGYDRKIAIENNYSASSNGYSRYIPPGTFPLYL